MGSDDPSVDEIRDVFRLVNACCERWDDPRGWQALLLSGVKRMIGLDLVVLQLAKPGADHQRPEVLSIASMGLKTPESERLYLESISGADRPQLPNVDKALGPALAEGSVAFSRPMVIPDDMWYACEFYCRYVEPVGMDEWTSSFRMAPQLGAVVMVGGNRAQGAEAMPMRNVKLLGILGEEISPLIGSRLSIDGQVSKAGLTPRQRQTLDLLLDGLSEKQVAGELGLSRATVHDYVVKLHRHFDVSSRGELLSYFIKRKPKDASPEG